MRRHPTSPNAAPHAARSLLSILACGLAIAGAPGWAAAQPSAPGGPIVLLADPQIRGPIAEALAVELSPLRLGVIQADAPLGDTPLARAASAQATAVAQNAQAAVWIEAADNGVVVRTVLADAVHMDEVALTNPSPRAIAVVAAGQLEGRLIPGAEPPEPSTTTSTVRLRVQVPRSSGDPLFVEAELSASAPQAPPAAAPPPPEAPAPAAPAPAPSERVAPEPPAEDAGPHVFGWIGGAAFFGLAPSIVPGIGGQAGVGIDLIPELRIALGGTVGWMTAAAAETASRNVISVLSAAEIGPRFAIGDVHLTTSVRVGMWVSEESFGAVFGPLGGLGLGLEIPLTSWFAMIVRAQCDLVYSASPEPPVFPANVSDFFGSASLILGVQAG